MSTTTTTTTTIKPLPLEVHGIILSHINNRKSLAESRLVCKAWSDLAEREMFSLPIRVKADEEAADRLALYLTKKPHLATHISALDIDCNMPENAVESLLRVAFTPSMRTLTAKNIDDNPTILYDTIVDIAQQLSPVKFDKLVRIPFDPEFCQETCQEALNLFKPTLTTVVWRLSGSGVDQAFSEIVASTPHLKSLHLALVSDDISQLEANLKGDYSFTELKLQAFNSIAPLRNDGRIMTKTQVKAWAQGNVKPITSVKTLRILPIECRSYMNYLQIKFPNVQRLYLESNSIDQEEVMDSLGSVSRSLLGVIGAVKKHLPLFSIQYNIPWHHNVEKVLETLFGFFSSFELGYHQHLNNEVIQMTIQRQKVGGSLWSTHYAMLISPITQQHGLIMKFMRERMTLRLYHIKMDLLNRRLSRLEEEQGSERYRISPEDETCILIDLISAYVNVQSVRFICQDLTGEADFDVPFMVTALQRLEICGAMIGENLFPVINDICSNMQRFNLVNCFIYAEQRRVAHVRMTDCHDLNFSFCAEPCEYVVPDQDVETNEPAMNHVEGILKLLDAIYSQVTYFWLSIHQTKQRLHFRLMPNDKTTHLISKQDFDARSETSPVIHLLVLSVKSILISVGKIYLSVDQDLVDDALGSSFVADYDYFDEELEDQYDLFF